MNVLKAVSSDTELQVQLLYRHPILRHKKKNITFQLTATIWNLYGGTLQVL